MGGWGRARGSVEFVGKVDRILMDKLKAQCHLEHISR
jgi:hypothetical protein